MVTHVIANHQESTLLQRQKPTVWKEASASTCRVLLVLPEHLDMSTFQKMITGAMWRHRLLALIIDEAHLAHKWGTDFRSSYDEVSSIKDALLAHTACICLTATLAPGTDEQVLTSYIHLNKPSVRRLEGRRSDLTLQFRQHKSSSHDQDLLFVAQSGVEQVEGMETYLVFVRGIRSALHLKRALRSAVRLNL